MCYRKFEHSSMREEILLTNAEGYLLHAADWNEDVAMQIAEQEGLSLDQERWYIIYQLRTFYLQHHKFPALRILIQKKIKPMLCNHLFPKGLLKQAAKIAGLPKPTR